MKEWQHWYPHWKFDHQLPHTELWLLMKTSSGYLDLAVVLAAPLIRPASSYSTKFSDSVTAMSLSAAGMSFDSAPYLSSSSFSRSMRIFSASSRSFLRENSPAVGLACRCWPVSPLASCASHAY